MTRSVLPLSSPFFQMRPRERVQKWASPVSTVRASASAFIQASIRTSPLLRSVTMAGSSPSAPNLGVKRLPLSISSVVPRLAKRGGDEGGIPPTPLDDVRPKPGARTQGPHGHFTGASCRDSGHGGILLRGPAQEPRRPGLRSRITEGGSGRSGAASRRRGSSGYILFGQGGSRKVNARQLIEA